MIKLFLLVALLALLRKSGSSPLSLDENEDTPATTEHEKDLYVVHAVVYEVGILTNATNTTQNTDDSKGEQVAVTFYHKNGSDVDFSKIPEPLYTNVTGHVLTGLAEAAGAAAAASPPESLNETPSEVAKETTKKRATIWDAQYEGDDDNPCDNSNESTEDDNMNNEFKREVLPSTIEPRKKMNKREIIVEPEPNNNNHNNDKINNTNLVNPEYNDNNDKISNTLNKLEPNSNEWDVRKDVFTLTPESSVQSIAIPPLLSLNANLSQIPVPIPNTSILSYSSLSTHTKPANDE